MNFTDQIGNTIIPDSYPKRIISLVPSQTELLSYFGLEEEVVGITKFCVHPEAWFHTKTRVGGTKNVNFEKIAELKPDLIICNKEENKKSDVQFFTEKYEVWTSDIHNLDDAYRMIASLGEIVNKTKEAEQLISRIKINFEELNDNIGDGLRALYLIWKDPFMAAGEDTFINCMMEKCNLVNVLKNKPERYPELTTEQIRDLNPDVILLSSEPYPFKEKHIQEFNLYFPGTLCVLVNGEYFSWYGSRLRDAPQYFMSLLKTLKV